MTVIAKLQNLNVFLSLSIISVSTANKYIHKYIHKINSQKAALQF